MDDNSYDAAKAYQDSVKQEQVDLTPDEVVFFFNDLLQHNYEQQKTEFENRTNARNNEHGVM